MPEGGLITFRSRCAGDQVFLEVGDTGIGMTKRSRKDIRSFFYDKRYRELRLA